MRGRRGRRFARGGYLPDLRELNELKFDRFRAEVRSQLAESETRLIRWMFAFWAPTALGSVGTAVAVVALLLRS